MKVGELEKLRNELSKCPGINGKEEYFNSAVLVLLVMIDEEYYFLFEKRAENIRQPGEICFPGGGYESKRDNNFQETAIRETVEELGIKEEAIDVIGRMNTIITPTGITVDAFLAIANISGLKELKINKKEVAEVFMIPISYFKENEPQEYSALTKTYSSYINDQGEKISLLPAQKLGLPENYNVSWGEFRYKILVYEVEDNLIWGITARLVYDVIKKLKSIDNN